jgi:replicative DNA helicase
MVNEPGASRSGRGADRLPPSSEEAERGVLGSMLLDANRVIDLCLSRQLIPESFYVPAHRTIYETVVAMYHGGGAVDVLTVTSRLDSLGMLDQVGGSTALDHLIDATPTAAHAEYYIDIVRQKHLLRCIIDCSRETEQDCYAAEDSADLVLSRAEQAFLNITERQHGQAVSWPDAVKGTMEHIDRILTLRRGLTGISTGFLNLDRLLQGMRPGEMIVLAARPSMGKTSLAMNIAENVALGRNDPDRQSHPVGIFSLEMPYEQLVMRMLCSHAGVRSQALADGRVAVGPAHSALTTAASVLMKAPIFLDDTGGLDIMELRARARRMRKRHSIELIVVDYLQLLHARDVQREGRQIEVAQVSGSLKAMAKELKVPVLVLSQLSRAPDQRDKLGKPKLSDLRDSGAIEQDADVVCMLRRPSKYPDDPQHEDETLAIVQVEKNRNGPTGETKLNFEDYYTRFTDRAQGVDGSEALSPFADEESPIE